MNNDKRRAQEDNGTISWLACLGVFTLGLTTVCALGLALLFLLSAGANAYLAWTMSGYQVSLNTRTPETGAVLIITPTPTAIPPRRATSTPTPTLPPTPSRPEGTYATLRAVATAVALQEAKETEVAGTPGTPGTPTPAVDLLPDTGSGSRLKTIPYVVQSGDTLWLIAVREYGSGLSWPVIFEGNRNTLTNPNRIWPGQVLYIPVHP